MVFSSTKMTLQYQGVQELAKLAIDKKTFYSYTLHFKHLFYKI